MKKHEILKIKTEIFAEIASYVDEMITRYSNESEHAQEKIDLYPDEEFYKERVEEYEQRIIITASIYDKILKEF